ncbi:hypothetical protein SPRG_15685 [Saprolegnia parasitica CBS 223.65]|uniref:Uncharacterized protein n=1 Tax=Saprolegnia parasitica (strain CBS 223.65) TaxID=695850 RepID=A0A067BX62_SAPPC|nr:hypothetical protein SPRG_15685 [Saprolegnia parasitica CBS 223.65]KDO19162.1 hypothetical protein SPRG_15685 [Saprolegnia parasitica CBS 223.65]|eukprot:XP_012210132.1 hypothetical protein SPRG_15685 [Saprolegnia parasitica CBS 223.65]
MAPPTYKDKTYLYVLPEQVPGAQKTLKCRTIATKAVPAVEFEVPKNDCKLQIVTAKEATTAPLGHWLCQFVVLAHEGRAFTGQVQAVHVEDEMFTVVCAHQRVKFDVSLTPPEEAEKRMKRARRIHARIEKRITDPAEGSRDLAVILAEIMPDGEEVPATIDLVSPATGKKSRVSAQHVVDHLFYSVEGRKAPEDGSVGDQYWEDPRFGDMGDDELEERPESDHPGSSDSEVAMSDDSVLTRRSVRPVNTPKEPLKRPSGVATPDSGVYWENGNQRSEAIVVRAPHPSDSSPAGPQTQFWRGDDAEMDCALAHARYLAGFGDAGPAKRPRAEFNPNAIEMGIHCLALKPKVIAYIKKSLGGFNSKFKRLEAST